MRRFLVAHPITTALGLTVLYFLVLAAPNLGSSAAFGSNPARTPQSVPQGQLPLEIGLAVSVVAIVFLLGWGRDSRFTSRPSWSGLWYALPPALLMILFLGVGVLTAQQQGMALDAFWASGIISNVLLLVIFVGIFEETLFRGLVMHGLEQRIGPIAALLISSVLFGSMHYVNWISGQALDGTHQQVIHAALSGLLFGAITLRTRSIWPAVFLHALWDFTVFMIAATIGDIAGTADVPAQDTTTVIMRFLFQYFHPIFGLIALYGWYRWDKRQRAAIKKQR